MPTVSTPHLPGFDAEQLKQDLTACMDRSLDSAMAEFKEAASRCLAGPDSNPIKFNHACDTLLKTLKERARGPSASFIQVVHRNLQVPDGVLGQGLNINPGELMGPLRVLD